MASIVTVTDALAARALAARICDPDRVRHYVVVTTTPADTAAVDATALAAGLDADHEIDLIDPRVVRDLAADLPAGGDVWPGIVRAYSAEAHPTDTRYWITEPGQGTDTLTRDIITHLSGPTAVQPSHPAPAATETPPRFVDTPAAANQLATHLLDPQRSRPLVLCSTPAGAQTPYADPHQIYAAIGDLADIVTITTGPATRALAHRLPRGLEAFGGACRVYPLGTDWLNDRDQARLRFAYSPTEGTYVTRQLINDAWRAIPAAPAATHTQAAALPATGRVLGLAGGRGLVQLESGQLASIWPEQVAADLAAEQLLVEGMTVQGDWDPDSGRIDITGMLVGPAVALAGYRPGTQVLVRALPVTDDHALPVELMPSVQGTITRAHVTSTTLALADLVSPGEILVARVLSSDPWELDLDIDDQAPIATAPALLAGGPAWLALPDPEPQLDAAPESGPDATIVPPSAGAEPAQAPGNDQVWEQERDQLITQLEREQGKTRRLRDELARARTRLRTLAQDHQRLTAAHQRLQTDTSRHSDDAHLFSDSAEQFDFELRLAWARRIPAAQKHELPLRTYHLGDDFLSSLDAAGADRRKVVDIVVEILTGLHIELDSRDLHQLRTSDAGNAAAVTRPDGATCWRVSVQRKSPQARRLHYWQNTDGSIELASVRIHDDMRP